MSVKLLLKLAHQVLIFYFLRNHGIMQAKRYRCTYCATIIWRRGHRQSAMALNIFCHNVEI